MSKVSQAIGRVFSGGAKAFARYPAAMFSALIVAVAATALTALDMPADERLFTNMMLAFAASALWGLAVAVACEYYIGKQIPFILLNLITLLAGSGLRARRGAGGIRGLPGCGRGELPPRDAGAPSAAHRRSDDRLRQR